MWGRVQINTWMEGSYSPVHRHDHHAESFVVLEVRPSLSERLGTSPALCAFAARTLTPRRSLGAVQGVLAFFTFTVEEGQGAGAAPVDVTCHLLGPHVRTRGIIVEQREWHAMTAAPASLGYPGAYLALVLALGAQRSPPVGPSRPSPSELAPALLPFAVLRRSRGLRRVRRAVLCCAVCVCVCRARDCDGEQRPRLRSARVNQNPGAVDRVS